MNDKLTNLLSTKTTKSSSYQIYTQIYLEFEDFQSEFKSLLETLRKRLIVSGIKEKDSENFEYKNEVDDVKSEIKALFDKEIKEKSILVKKLNLLSDQHFTLSKEHQECKEIALDMKKLLSLLLLNL